MTEAQFPTVGVRDQIRSASSRLHQTTLDVLADMYGADNLKGTESDRPILIRKGTRIAIEQGAMMHQIMRANSVRRSLEVGFGYGFSTVWMLDALRSQRNALHVAVDPYERTLWHGIGITQVKRLASGVRFEWIEDFSIHALSDLIRKKEKFDFIFIDGNHRFDDVIVDFYLANQVLRIGGLIAFDDLSMNSVRTATNFILNNRSYELVPQPVDRMLVLKKTGYDDRDWTHFNNFSVHGFSQGSEPPLPEPPATSNGGTRLHRILGKIFRRPGGGEWSAIRWLRRL